MIKHPAVYTDIFIPIFAGILSRPNIIHVFDPFAGTGKIFELNKMNPYIQIEAIEIEPEFIIDKRVKVGNALNNGFPDGKFDAIVTSPTYVNRMADSFEAKDSSHRMTYRHRLGRKLHPQNSGQLQWGEEYRDFHEKAWQETRRVLRSGGLFVLNVKDHIRSGKVQEVSNWHRKKLGEWLYPDADICVPVKGNGFGQNGKVRVNYEHIYVFTKP